MSHIIAKAAATCAVAGLLVFGGEMPRSGQQGGVYVGPSSAFASVHRYRRYWRVPQYDTSGAPANPCSLGKAQQNRC